MRRIAICSAAERQIRGSVCHGRRARLLAALASGREGQTLVLDARYLDSMRLDLCIVGMLGIFQRNFQRRTSSCPSHNAPTPCCESSNRAGAQRGASPQLAARRALKR